MKQEKKVYPNIFIYRYVTHNVQVAGSLLSLRQYMYKNNVLKKEKSRVNLTRRQLYLIVFITSSLSPLSFLLFCPFHFYFFFFFLFSLNKIYCYSNVLLVLWSPFSLFYKIFSCISDFLPIIIFFLYCFFFFQCASNERRTQRKRNLSTTTHVLDVGSNKTKQKHGKKSKKNKWKKEKNKEKKNINICTNECGEQVKIHRLYVFFCFFISSFQNCLLFLLYFIASFILSSHSFHFNLFYNIGGMVYERINGATHTSPAYTVHRAAYSYQKKNRLLNKWLAHIMMIRLLTNYSDTWTIL